MGKWTPGPWSRGKIHPQRIFGGNARLIATNIRQANDPTTQEDEANARLIAAAPEMAELLERLTEAKPWDRSEYEPIMIEARALLTKIGGQP